MCCAHFGTFGFVAVGFAFASRRFSVRAQAAKAFHGCPGFGLRMCGWPFGLSVMASPAQASTGNRRTATPLRQGQVRCSDASRRQRSGR